VDGAVILADFAEAGAAPTAFTGTSEVVFAVEGLVLGGLLSDFPAEVTLVGDWRDASAA
jgi:hypothetical protein